MTLRTIRPKISSHRTGLFTSKRLRLEWGNQVFGRLIKGRTASLPTTIFDKPAQLISILVNAYGREARRTRMWDIIRDSGLPIRMASRRFRMRKDRKLGRESETESCLIYFFGRHLDSGENRRNSKLTNCSSEKKSTYRA